MKLFVINDLLLAICNRNESFFEILTRLHRGVDKNGLKNIVNVDRNDVLDGGFRAFKRPTFNTRMLLNVKFSGEYGVDADGLSREFMRLFLK